MNAAPPSRPRLAVVVGLLCVLAAAFAVFVWPTRWRYFRAIPIGMGERTVARECRFTGRMEFLLGRNGWK